MTVRLRLTLLYTGILALTLLAFGVILYVTVEGTTNRVLQDGLRADMTRLTETKEFRLDKLSALPVGKGKPIPIYTYVRSLGPAGEPLDSTGSADEALALPPLSAEQLGHLQGDTPLFTTSTILGDRWLIYSKRVVDGGKAPGIVQLARPIDDTGSLATLRRNLIIGGLIAVACAFGCGFLLARLALQPIGRITATARAIERSQDFSRRIQHADSRDEVGQLARTLDAMLAALQAAHEQTEGALQAQRRFVADASHELRTPLTTIRGNLGLLARIPPIGADDRRAVLADMIEEAERMSRLINNLLTLARADAGRPTRAVPVPVAPLVADICRQVRSLAPHRAIACAAAGEVALADPDALRQILLILLDNAIRHTPAGTAIGVTTAARGATVALTVRDDGPGVPPEVRPLLFERFYRADSARTGDGAGLGLPIARALVEAQGGTIAVESAPGQGSAFTVTLPAAPVAATHPSSETARV